MRWRPTLMMAGAGNVISQKGGQFIYSHFYPLMHNSNIDFSLSDIRAKSAPQNDSYILKPYVFTSGKYGKEDIFECRTPICEKDFYKRKRVSVDEIIVWKSVRCSIMSNGLKCSNCDDYLQNRSKQTREFFSKNVSRKNGEY